MTQLLKIKIAEKNRGKINAAIDKAQAGARARLCTYDNCKNVVFRAEKHLHLFGVKKSAWIGCKATYAESVCCNSYGSYSAESTLIEIERYPSGWFFVDAYRIKKFTMIGVEEYHFAPSQIAIDTMVERQKQLFSDF